MLFRSTPVSLTSRRKKDSCSAVRVFISLAYQVKGFDEVLEVEAQLMDNGLTPVTAAKQVESLKETFTQLQTLFVIVSGFIVVIALIAAADG